ncbi:MCP four helix bundle domain-containing protein [Catalinimonas niigatensis]|uniref:MCP four helix bundle domain-containing protein n=1 Tax=Catalinimonas niigatensis TaxID=1397264 RepID=UPI002665CDA6|nr:MCP four helix bundle domain-containing protein [Catalinimonas niigatensis]WPP49888.1 MCP four helix bundle domain-containing protein [Catalinimonas niigatensis]
MRFLNNFSNKERILFSFLVVLVLINMLTLVTSRNLSDFSYDFKSMLEDRLIPASDLAKIQEQFYRNRINLEELIYLDEYEYENAETVIRHIRENDLRIDRIEDKYAKTHLTVDEENQLKEFNERFKNYRDIENKIIKYIEHNKFQEASNVYLHESIPAFEKLLDITHKLEDIQLVVGNKLYRHAQTKVRNIQVLAYLSLGIALIITAYILKVLQFKVK